MTLARTLAAGALCLGIAATPLHAQGAPDVLPTRLALALFGSWEDAGALHLTVGTPPAGWPAELLPPKGSPVGGATMRGSLVAVFEDTSSRALLGYQRLLESRGFTRPQPTSPGFQASGTGAFDSFCRDSLRVGPSMVRGARPALLRVVYSVQEHGGACVTNLQRLREQYPLVIPPLTPPPGAQSTGGGGGTGSRETQASAVVVDSTRDAAAIATHYASQLAAAGWTAGTARADAHVAIVPLAAKAKDGTQWTGMLTVLTEGSRHAVAVTMHSPER